MYQFEKRIVGIILYIGTNEENKIIMDMPKRTTITSIYNHIDSNGNKVHAHGGSFIESDGTWYWFDEKPRLK